MEDDSGETAERFGRDGKRSLVRMEATQNIRGTRQGDIQTALPVAGDRPTKGETGEE